jgi:capsular polysaccharide biosynthesis protein
VALPAAWYRAWEKISKRPVLGSNQSKENKMSKLVIGFVLGLVVASVGFSGIARIMDKGVQTIQTQSKELAQ